MEGIERIKQLAADIKDEALLEIINYLISREDMNEKYLNEEKSLKQMVNFIRNEAQKLAKNNKVYKFDNYNNLINLFVDNNDDKLIKSLYDYTYIINTNKFKTITIDISFRRKISLSIRLKIRK